MAKVWARELLSDRVDAYSAGIEANGLIAICLFFMMYPIMVKIDFGEVVKAGKSIRPVGLTLFINWAIKPFTMYAIASFFLGTLFLGFIGPDAVDFVKASGAALATVVGVLIEVPLMLLLVKFCVRTKNWFPFDPLADAID